MRPDNNPRPLKKSEAQAAAGVMDRAFAGDPFTRHVLGPEATSGPEFHRMDVNYGLKYGRAMTLGAVEGLSIWLPPGDVNQGFFRMIRCGLLKGSRSMGWGALRRFLNLGGQLSEIHKKLLPGPHWYLYILAVDPALQNQRLGSRLLAPGLAWAEQDGLPLYLETLNPRAPGFYAHHGFEVAHHGKALEGPEFWSLIRRPG